MEGLLKQIALFFQNVQKPSLKGGQPPHLVKKMKFGLFSFCLLGAVNKHPNYIKKKFEGDLTSIMVTWDFFGTASTTFFALTRQGNGCGVDGKHDMGGRGWRLVLMRPDEHHDPLPQAIFKKLKPIYMCLASKDLFQRCLHCATQNAESFYGLVWSYCPRESLCGADTVACLQPCCTAIQSLHVPSHTGCTAGGYGCAQLASTTWMHWN